ncbi:ethanolamine utilization microcompartment protein EutS [Photobacterium gaetbulicola]|uniref:Microcompartments protein n=2 Tax=Photobacterium gaetbulicola TaxID=1295392 RepID=A0A0C5X0V3_9GAMM|nr:MULTISPECIES: ethanolamine utilization microcompartment protein EutS [Photobacterium]AJR08955.1 microcompartments protein [Photobacterium gaetbulicola Gung47]KHT63571.1 carboxysome shell protein [Photobacterium gaetbulicola]PSU13511.1 ethanolamine utilization microcompartment protein EutS [Photobacterium gaetbulicola]WEM41083.1 ethanolamine utilization microcompartment protein EutS [Photobacterium sp. DA100]
MLDLSSGKERIIQEFVPGKQVTLAHLVANPTEELCERVGVESKGAIGILTLTPGETSIIAGDIATKSANVNIGFLDRFSGALVITGSVASVDEALKTVISVLNTTLSYNTCEITRT